MPKVIVRLWPKLPWPPPPSTVIDSRPATPIALDASAITVFASCADARTAAVTVIARTAVAIQTLPLIPRSCSWNRWIVANLPPSSAEPGVRDFQGFAAISPQVRDDGADETRKGVRRNPSRWVTIRPLDITVRLT